MTVSYIKKILQAPVYDVAIETPISEASNLSKRIDNRVLIKREDLQPVFSFKLRGAYNKMVNLTEEEKKRGVIAASAGNHAQGVALAAKKMGISAKIVMPKVTPAIKVDSVKARGAEVVLYGDTFDVACRYAKELEKEEGRVFIHPYDDPDVIAGQGTIGMEIMRQSSGDLDMIFVPVGGGGLIAGISLFVKYLRPDIKIIGVESEDSACLYEAMKYDQRITLPRIGTFAEGVAVAQIGEETFNVARQCVDDVITISNDEICAAIKDIFQDTRSIAEPAGALALAGLKKYAQDKGLKEKNLLAICSGANMNFDRLRYISERTEIGEKTEAILSVTVPEQELGSFKTFCETLEETEITEFNYRHSDQKNAHIFLGVKIDASNDSQLSDLIKRLEEKGYPVLDLSDDETAKIHVRYMIGGHTSDIKNEVVYRFQFPQKPAALPQFFTAMEKRKWNITLFHYRNHGAAYGLVLMGLDVPVEEKEEVHSFFEKLGYFYTEVTDNKAYKTFLG